MARKLVLMTAVVALLTVSAGASWAAPVTVLCPNPMVGTGHQFSLTTDPAGASCYAFGGGNLEGSNSDFAGWTFIDKDEGNSLTDNWFQVTGMLASSGTFTIDPAAWGPLGYSSLMIGLKAGNNLEITYAAFVLPAGETSGSWTITPTTGGGLSHAILYGQGTPVVPEPASMVLLGSGLLGLAAKARRRQKK